MNKKRLIITGIIIAILVLTVGTYLYLQRTKTATTGVPGTPFQINLPTSKIKVSGVEVNNFKKAPADTNSQGDVLFVSDPDYHLVYLEKFNEFIITILGSPFEEVRTRAENDFLARLGITKEAACKLKVSLGAPAFANPEEAGKTYRLSFCQ